MTRRHALAIAVCAAACALFTPALRGAGAGEPDPGDQLLAESRAAAVGHDFFGTVRVEWTDEDGAHAENVTVRSERGVLALGDRGQIVIQGARRYVVSDGGWSLLWSRRSRPEPPAASDKWDLRLREGPQLAGRDTRAVEAADPESGKVRERVFIDQDTNLLLGRELLDADGRVVRAVQFVRFGEVPSTGPESRPPHAPSHGAARQPDVLHDVHEPFHAPQEAGHGFRLLGSYRQPDGTVQLYYSDGLFGASVFEQEGRLDWDALPPGGVTAKVAGHRAREYRTATGSVVVWQSKGIVYTCVSDAPLDELDGIVANFPARASRSVLQRVADFLFDPFSW